MSDVADPLREDVAELQALVRYQGVLIEKLKHQLAGLRRHRFGTRSEALDQLELTLEETEIAAAAGPAVQPVAVPALEKDPPKRRALDSRTQWVSAHRPSRGISATVLAVQSPTSRMVLPSGGPGPWADWSTESSA